LQVLVFSQVPYLFASGLREPARGGTDVADLDVGSLVRRIGSATRAGRTGNKDSRTLVVKELLPRQGRGWAVHHLRSRGSHRIRTPGRNWP
jgi:hypothetical protein